MNTTLTNGNYVFEVSWDNITGEFAVGLEGGGYILSAFFDRGNVSWDGRYLRLGR